MTPESQPATEETPRPAWVRWFTLAVTVFAIGALAVTVWTVGPRTLWGQLLKIGPWFGVIFALEVLATLCDVNILNGFLGRGGRRPGYRGVLKAQVAGRAINVVTPMASLGEATKVAILMRSTDPGRAVATVVRFNLSYIAANLLFIVLGAPLCAIFLDLPGWMEKTLWIGTGVAVSIAIALIVLVRAGLVASAIKVLRFFHLISRDRFGVWRDRLRKLDATMKGETGLRSWAPALWTIAAKLIGSVGTWLVLYANGEAPSFGVMAALATAGTLINVAANVVPLGLGVSEGGTAALMAALGESPTLGVTIVIARRVVYLVYAALGLTILAADENLPSARAAAKAAKAGKAGKPLAAAGAPATPNGPGSSEATATQAPHQG